MKSATQTSPTTTSVVLSNTFKPTSSSFSVPHSDSILTRSRTDHLKPEIKNSFYAAAVVSLRFSWKT